jgi:hypothetical protein
VIAVQKRSGKRHLIHPDGYATLCGRTLYRNHWRREHGLRLRIKDCVRCMRVRRAQESKTGQT